MAEYFFKSIKENSNYCGNLKAEKKQGCFPYSSPRVQTPATLINKSCQEKDVGVVKRQGRVAYITQGQNTHLQTIWSSMQKPTNENW